MKRPLSSRVLVGVVGLLGLLVASAGIPEVRAEGPNPLRAIRATLAAIQAEINDPEHGLGEIKNEVRAIEAKLAIPTGPFRLSSGLFGLPADAASVDWVVVNNSSSSEVITVTVWEHPVGLPRTSVPPGSLTITLGPFETTHNANSVGAGQPFHLGGLYEVVVETSSPNVVPTADVWQDESNTVIAGTTISPGSWVRLQ